jgi:hypothetical protein
LTPGNAWTLLKLLIDFHTQFAAVIFSYVGSTFSAEEYQIGRMFQVISGLEQRTFATLTSLTGMTPSWDKILPFTSEGHQPSCSYSCARAGVSNN